MNITIRNANGRTTEYTPKQLTKEARYVVQTNSFLAARGGAKVSRFFVEVLEGAGARLVVHYTVRDGGVGSVTVAI